MRFLILTIAVFVLTGCNEGERFTKLHNLCEQSVPYHQMGQCLNYSLDESMPNWRADKHAGYVQTYIAWLNAVGERVVKGEVSEADMKFGATQLLNRMRTEAKQVQQADFGNRMAIFLSGLAIMNAGGSAYSPTPQTTTIWSPGNRPISCTESLNTISCF
jgi:hypothetical protein